MGRGFDISSASHIHQTHSIFVYKLSRIYLKPQNLLPVRVSCSCQRFLV